MVSQSFRIVEEVSARRYGSPVSWGVGASRTDMKATKKITTISPCPFISKQVPAFVPDSDDVETEQMSNFEEPRSFLDGLAPELHSQLALNGVSIASNAQHQPADSKMSIKSPLKDKTGQKSVNSLRRRIERFYFV